MHPSFFIARRYLFSGRKKSIITLISWISLVGIAVGTTALIVVLSVYNGIGKLTQNLFDVFDPELIIEPMEGKTFHTESIAYTDLCRMQGAGYVSQLAEENAWITHKHNEAIVQLRGVDESYQAMTGLDTLMYEGCYVLKSEVEQDSLGEDEVPMHPTYFLLFGGEIYDNLGLNSYTNSPVALHIPKRGSGIGMTMEDAFNIGYAYPAGCFFIQKDIDMRYVVAPIELVRQLMNYAPDEVTSIAVSVANGYDVDEVKAQIQQLLGSEYSVKDRFEQQPLYYKVFKSERMGVFLILSLIVLIATLNLIASLSLLIIDKRRDIHTLRSIGMDNSTIRRTFFIEGVLIALVGVASGLVLGFLICFVQQQFGIIKMGSNFITDAFPVAMRLLDFVATFAMVSLLSLLAVTFTVKKARI